MAANKQIISVQTIFTGLATFAMVVLFHTTQVGAGGFAADGDDEAQLQQQLQTQQLMQQAEQQAEEQEQLANQQAQQAEQQGQQVEQQATLSVPGS